MDVYFRCCGGILIGVILIVTLGKSELSAVLSMAICCLTAAAGFFYLEPVLGLIRQLEALGNLSPNLIGILLKAVGLGLVTEVAVLVCKDSGNASLGKSLQILGNCVLLWLSIPIFSALLDLIQKILGEL